MTVRLSASVFRAAKCAILIRFSKFLYRWIPTDQAHVSLTSTLTSCAAFTRTSMTSGKDGLASFANGLRFLLIFAQFLSDRHHLSNIYPLWCDALLFSVKRRLRHANADDVTSKCVFVPHCL